MEQSVDKGDLTDAIEQMKSLPPEAQKTLADWRAAAEARLQLDDALHDDGRSSDRRGKTGRTVRLRFRRP